MPDMTLELTADYWEGGPRSPSAVVISLNEHEVITIPAEARLAGVTREDACRWAIAAFMSDIADLVEQAKAP